MVKRYQVWQEMVSEGNLVEIIYMVKLPMYGRKCFLEAVRKKFYLRIKLLFMAENVSWRQSCRNYIHDLSCHIWQEMFPGSSPVNFVFMNNLSILRIPLQRNCLDLGYF